MKTVLAGCLGAVLSFAPAPVVHGQQSRFELGQRLRAFEVAWEQQPDTQARARALPHLNTAVRDFFGFRLDLAAESLDRARWAVQSDAEPSPAILWANSLSLQPEARLLSGGTAALKIQLVPFYQIAVDMPDQPILRLALHGGPEKPVAAVQERISGMPWQGTLPIATVSEGDYRLTAEFEVAGDRILLSSQTISVVTAAPDRLQSLEDRLTRLPEKPNTTQRATLAAHLDILKTLLAGGTPETDYPAARLLREAEAILESESAGTNYFRSRPGEFWITLADPGGSVPVRLLAPDAVADDSPLPLVIALHGAGGSENMFFDAYGAGKIVELCRQRGWMLVAPRLSFFGLGMSADHLIAEIGRLYPIDGRQVFVVGHSMGAAQAVSLAQRVAKPFVAVAAIGGGGRVGAAGDWTQTEFLVIAGDQDFGRPGAQRLSQALRAAGAVGVRWSEYPDTEHLGAVQAALPEVFAFFDEVVAETSGHNTAKTPRR